MQYHVILYNTMQDNAIPCKTKQYRAIPCNTMQYHAILCNTMQYHAIPCNTMRGHAIPCNTLQYHASLLTADGAYHCPVDSCRPFFHIHALQIHHMLIDLDCRRNKPALFFPGSTSYADDMRIPWSRGRIVLNILYFSVAHLNWPAMDQRLPTWSWQVGSTSSCQTDGRQHCPIL